MSVKVGQIYKSICKTDDPFFEPYYMMIMEIKTDSRGERWFKICFARPDETGKFKEGLLDSSERESNFLRRFSLYSEGNDNVSVSEPQIQQVKSAIDQLEVEE